jgi:hypothetical protein
MGVSSSEGLGQLAEGAGVVEELAHRMCWRYKHSSDPAHSHTYTFNRTTLLQFAGALMDRQRKRAQDAEVRGLRLAGWFYEVPSAMSYRLWEQGHEDEPNMVALYERV